jgi:4-hydroxybenzoate polyprenyltransferase
MKQDKKDDVLVNVKSTALRFGENSRTVLTGLGTTFVSLLTYAGYAAGAGPLYYLISCLGAASHLTWQLRTVDFESRADCWNKFVSNGRLGGLVWAGMFVDYLAQVYGLLGGVGAS